MRRLISLLGMIFILSSTAWGVEAQAKQPNILVIWGDDIGWSNISSYNMGMMGYKTPNIDRIANEGMLFTDSYGQQSCTAGRAAFITGQHPFRTGLMTVGLPGSPIGLQPEDPTIADLLKEQGYVTGQFGKNHLGDLNKFLPTVHGFDEFFGSLYHLNAEEEPEDSQYPHHIEGFYEAFGPRGNLDCKAINKDDATDEPRWGRVGKQVCKDTGPVTRKRMETIENELLERSTDFMERAVKDDKPFFIWHNALRMHVWTRL
jgi:arylsulfatase A-like enzyme